MFLQVVLLYLKSEDYEFEKIAQIVLKSLSSAGITVISSFYWNNTYNIGYMDNPFHKLVEDTFRDTRSE